MGRVTKKATVHSITLKHINEKLDHIHKDIDENTKDISKLKEQVAMGRGGIESSILVRCYSWCGFYINEVWAGIK